MNESIQCVNCRHYRGLLTCEAFPDPSRDGGEGRIPQDILDGTHDHREPYEGDEGIRFEPLVIDDPA